MQSRYAFAARKLRDLAGGSYRTGSCTQGSKFMAGNIFPL